MNSISMDVFNRFFTFFISFCPCLPLYEPEHDYENISEKQLESDDKNIKIINDFI